MTGWEMVVDGIPAETVAERALDAVQAFIATNAEMIEVIRTDERPPARWVGSVTGVKTDTEEKIQVVALTETAFAEAVSREPFDLDSHHALQAMVGAGYVVTRTEKKPDGKTVVRQKIGVRVGGKALTRCVCVPVSYVFEESISEANDKINKDKVNEEEIPF